MTYAELLILVKYYAKEVTEAKCHADLIEALRKLDKYSSQIEYAWRFTQ
jgi:hypothetical protein